MRVLWTLLVFSVFLNLQFEAHSCEKAKQLYNRARQEQDLKKAAALLEESVDRCPTFNSWYLLGRVYGRVAAPKKAREAFTQAMKFTGGDKKKYAIALGRIGELLALEPTLDGIAVLQKAMGLHPAPPLWMVQLIRDLEISQMGRIVNSRQIRDSLSPANAARNFGVAPSINLRVNFKTDESGLNPHSTRQVQELKDALLSNEFKGKSFLLVGHTDARGSDGYNQALSIKRAQTVYRELVRLSPELEPRLKTMGCGENQLLYTGDSDEINQLNRRLEVSIVD